MATKDDRNDLRHRLIGLGKRSLKKSYYPELKKRLVELERFREALDQASDAIFLANANTGNIEDANETACSLTGYTKVELLNRSLFSLFDVDLLKFPTSTKPIVIQLKTATGSNLLVEFSVGFRTFTDTSYVICSVRDVSARLQAEEERESLIQELERKNIELERFLYTASHDLRTPLTTLKGFTGLLGEDLHRKDDEAVEKDLMRINEATDQMFALLNSVIEISRIGRMELRVERIRLSDLASEVIDEMQNQLDNRQAKVVVHPGLPEVNGDRSRLLEIFQNLLDNALKFTTNKGTIITISSSCCAHEHPVISVADQGIGINKRYHKNIFGLFNQLDPKRAGTGVGLTIVKRVVELHGGHIWVESDGKNKGATFCFTLGTPPNS